MRPIPQSHWFLPVTEKIWQKKGEIEIPISMFIEKFVQLVNIYDVKMCKYPMKLQMTLFC